MSSSPIRGSEASVDTIQDDGQTEDAIALSLGGDELGRTFAGSPKLGQELQDDLELLDALNMDDDVGRSQDIATSDDAGGHLQPERLEHSIEPDLRRPSSPGDSLSSPDDLPSIHVRPSISPVGSHRQADRLRRTLSRSLPTVVHMLLLRLATDRVQAHHLDHSIVAFCLASHHRRGLWLPHVPARQEF